MLNEKNLKRPLLEDNPELKNLEDKTRKISRMADEIKAFSNKLNTISISDYKAENSSLKEMMAELPQLLRSFYNTVSLAKSFSNYKDLIVKKDNFEKITEYEKKVEGKKGEIERYMNLIEEKESVMMGFSQPNDEETRKVMDNPNIHEIRDQMLQVQDIKHEREIMDQRHQEIAEIKKVSSQIRNITTDMNMKVNEQSQKIATLDDYVGEVKMNAIGAEQEIQIAQKNTKDLTRKILCLVFIIIFLLVSIGLIVWSFI